MATYINNLESKKSVMSEYYSPKKETFAYFDIAATATTKGLTISDHDKIERHPLGIVVPHDDHGNLSGLADDDHTQYLNTARHDTPDRHPNSVIKTATGMVSDLVPAGGGASIALNSYAFFPNIYVQDRAHVYLTGDSTEYTDYVARFAFWCTGIDAVPYGVRWRYITASNNPQVWVVQDKITGEIIGIWHSDDPPEIETDNPFKIIPIQHYDKNGKPYGIINYIEIPSFLDEFRATLRESFAEVKKRYKLREKSARPKLLPEHIRFCKLEKV